jgi:hypothetical protein
MIVIVGAKVFKSFHKVNKFLRIFNLDLGGSNLDVLCSKVMVQT